MEITGKSHINSRAMPAFAGNRYANGHLQKTVEEMFSLVDSHGKFGLHMDDLKMIFTDRRSQDVLRKHNVTAIELLKTDKAVFFGEVSYLFGQIDMRRWIDATKKYSSFTIIQEKPGGIVRLDENISSLNIPQLMARARQFNDDPKTLDIALEYYRRALILEPRNKHTIYNMRRVASIRYRDDLDNGLKIYWTILDIDPTNEGVIAVLRTIAHMQPKNDWKIRLKIYRGILERNPDDIDTKRVMRSVARKQYENDLKIRLEFYGAILEYKPDDEETLNDMMDIELPKYKVKGDLDSQLQIYDTIFVGNPTYDDAIDAMMNMANYDYPYNSPEFLAIMNTLERYHPTSEDNFDHSGLREKLLILKILNLKRDYQQIVRLTEDITAPELLKLRSEAQSKLK